MEPGYYYLTQNDGHRSILGITSNDSIIGRGFPVEPITDQEVLAFLKGE